MLWKVILVAVVIPLAVILVNALFRSRARLPQHPGADYLLALLALDLAMLIDPEAFAPIVVSEVIRKGFTTWVGYQAAGCFVAWAYVLGIAERRLIELYDFKRRAYNSRFALAWAFSGSALAWMLLAVHVGGFMVEYPFE